MGDRTVEFTVMAIMDELYTALFAFQMAAVFSYYQAKLGVLWWSSFTFMCKKLKLWNVGYRIL